MRLTAAAVLLLAVATTAAADDKVADGFALVGVVTPGTTLTIPGEFTPNAAIAVVLQPSNSRKTPRTVQGQVSDGALKVRVPDDLDPGPYTASFGDNQIIRGGIDVQVASVTLDAVHPATQYRGASDTFDFDLIGENFSPDACNDDVTVQGQGSIVRFRGTNRAECGGVPGTPARAKACAIATSVQPAADAPQGTCLWVEHSRLMHIVGYPAGPYQGPLTVNVRVGQVIGGQAQQLILARRSPATIFVLSAGSTALLLLLVWWTVSGGLARNKVGSRRLGLFESFIFDPETNTYSLSKFQLLLFSVAFMFGYSYVFLAGVLVQWKFALPDVPQNIAGLLGLSGGTTIAAAGLTAARGSKGAGLQRPTGADLISNGGVVVMERFQFFVWTIVSCIGFVMLLVSQDPAKVNGFPQIPDGLLYVMGVSALSYLGGKATRKPGPIIQSIAVDPKTPADPPVLIVQGQNLASDGRFFIDGRELPIVTDSQRTARTPDELIKVTPQEGAVDPKFATELEITIATPDVDIRKGDHRFRIVNRDGQFADITFSAQQPKIMSVVPRGTTPDDPQTKRLPASDQSLIVTVAGENLTRGSQVQWQPPGTTEPVSVTIVDQKDETSLQVSVVPGKSGHGILSVTTPSGFLANAMVVVGESSDQAPPLTAPLPTEPQPSPSPDTPDPATASAPSAGAPAPGPQGDAGGTPTSGSQGGSP